MSNKPFIFYKVLSEVEAQGTSAAFLDYIHSQNEELEGYSLLSFVKVLETKEILRVDASDVTTLNLLSKFSELINEEVYAYEINGLENDEE